MRAENDPAKPTRIRYVKPVDKPRTDAMPPRAAAPPRSSIAPQQATFPPRPNVKSWLFLPSPLHPHVSPSLPASSGTEEQRLSILNRHVQGLNISPDPPHASVGELRYLLPCCLTLKLGPYLPIVYSRGCLKKYRVFFTDADAVHAPMHISGATITATSPPSTSSMSRTIC